MTEARSNFELAEYAARIAKTRAAMVEKGIERIVVGDPSNSAAAG